MEEHQTIMSTRLAKLKRIIIVSLTATALLCGCQKQSSAVNSATLEPTNATTEIAIETTDASKVDLGTEKDIMGWYIFSGSQGDISLYLDYNEYYDKFQFQLSSEFPLKMISGSYSYKNGLITTEYDNDKDVKIQFYTNGEKEVVLDVDNSNIFDKLSDENNPLPKGKDAYIFKNTGKFTPEIFKEVPTVDISKVEFENATIANIEDVNAILGNYQLLNTDGWELEQELPTLQLMAEGNEKYAFELKSDITIKGEFMYQNGIIILSFDDEDKNFNITKTRYLFGYFSADNRLVLVPSVIYGSENITSALSYGPTGIPFFSSIIFEK